MLMGNQEHILYCSKFTAHTREVAKLPENLQWQLKTHLENLERGREVMERFNFKEGETAIVRGQPETEFKSLDPRNGNITVYVLGYGHWQIFKSGVRSKGTRFTDNLQSTLLKVIVWDDEQLEV